MSNMSNKFNRKSFLALLLSVILLAVSAAGAWFLYSEIKDTSKVIADASSNIALLQRKGKEFDESIDNLKKYSKEIERLRGSFLNEDNFVDLLKLFEEVARKAEVGFKAISAKVPTGESDGAALVFEVEGNEQTLMRFFNSLDKIPYSGMVEGATWIRQGKGSEKIKATANYTIFNFIK